MVFGPGVVHHDDFVGAGLDDDHAGAEHKVAAHVAAVGNAVIAAARRREAKVGDHLVVEVVEIADGCWAAYGPPISCPLFRLLLRQRSC